jgi:nucleoside-diphosphate-sugar epimerase
MKLTIVAATGGIGRLMLEQAVAAGHDVTAVVRDPTKLSVPVRAVTVDLSRPDAAALESAVHGADAVLSGLGPRSSAETGVATRGTRALIEAMKATGTRRIVVVSAAPLGTVPSPANPHPPRNDPGAAAVQQALDGPLPDRVRAKRPRWLDRLAGRCRAPDAARARPAGVDRSGGRGGDLSVLYGR